MSESLSRSFVGRSEQVERIVSRLREPKPAPLVVVGEPGMGRTSVVRAALDRLDPDEHALFELRAGDGSPLSSLRHLLPPDSPPRADLDAVHAAARAVAERAGDRRPVVLADDAHLADHASMLALQQLNRQSGAFLLLTHPDPVRPAHGHDPVDCLRYEQGLRTVRLPGLSPDEVGVVLAQLMDGPVRPATADALHAATGGNPGLLHDIVHRQRLRDRMVRLDGVWRLGDAPLDPGERLTCRGSAHLLAAIRDAWGALALARVEDLCRLAVWSGIAGEVALIRATVLLLRGQADQGVALLDEAPADGAETVLVRAMCLAFGQRRLDAAMASLAAATGPADRRLAGYRAWLLAAHGRAAEAAALLSDVDNRGDRHAGLFCHTARAIAALAGDRWAEAIAQLRRAVVLAEAVSTELPWMPPYLTAYLIDALLLAGRITEATAMAGEFHAATPGWNVAVALAALTSAGSAPERPVVPVRPEIA